VTLFPDPTETGGIWRVVLGRSLSPLSSLGVIGLLDSEVYSNPLEGIVCLRFGSGLVDNRDLRLFEKKPGLYHDRPLRYT